MNIFLYIIVVLIWGSTWIAIKLQLGIVPIEVSVFYRFGLAGIVLFVGLSLLRRRQSLTVNDHLFCLLQGACLFCFNFYAFYAATGYISSGLAAVIFSLSTIFNSINARIWFKKKPTKNTIIGSIIGVVGIVLMLWSDILQNNNILHLAQGFGLGVIGTIFFSCGNMLSVRHQNKGLTTPTTNAWAILYGTLIMLTIILIKDLDWQIDTSLPYLCSLLFLAIPGTVVGFTAYLILVGRIGADKAAYATVLFPIIALTISSIYEGYQWNVLAFIGLGLVISGNIITFRKSSTA